MTNKQKILTVLGFHLAGVNYLISGYQFPALFCFVISFFISKVMNESRIRKQHLISYMYVFIINLAIFCCGVGIMNKTLSYLILQLIFFQTLIEGEILIELCKKKESSVMMLKFSSGFYLVVCLLILICPHEILDYFLYSNLKGNGAIQVFILCSEIFVPLILSSLSGLLCNEMIIKKEPKHYFGSIK